MALQVRIGRNVLISAWYGSIIQLDKLEFDGQLRTAPKAPSDEGAVTEGDWGRENERIQQGKYSFGKKSKEKYDTLGTKTVV